MVVVHFPPPPFPPGVTTSSSEEEEDRESSRTFWVGRGPALAPPILGAGCYGYITGSGRVGAQGGGKEEEGIHHFSSSSFSVAAKKEKKGLKKTKKKEELPRDTFHHDPPPLRPHVSAAREIIRREMNTLHSKIRGNGVGGFPAAPSSLGRNRTLAAAVEGGAPPPFSSSWKWKCSPRGGKGEMRKRLWRWLRPTAHEQVHLPTPPFEPPTHRSTFR